MLAGRVTVNGRVVRELGARVDPDVDVIAVDGTVIKPRKPGDEYQYFLVNKPVGVISTAQDTHARPTVVGLVPSNERIYPVGRLDADSEGLLLLTNDGDLAYRLTHPRFEIEKEYRVLLDRAPTIDDLRRWREGVQLEDGVTLPAWVEILERGPDGAWVRIVMREGRKRQIRNVANLLGYEVRRLIRVREGPISLGDLPPGQWRALTPEEVAALREHTRHIPSRAEDTTAEERMKPPFNQRRSAAARSRPDARPSIRGVSRRPGPSTPPMQHAVSDREDEQPDRIDEGERARPRRPATPLRTNRDAQRNQRTGSSMRSEYDRARREQPASGGNRRAAPAERPRYDRSSSSMRNEYGRAERGNAAPSRERSRSGAPERPRYDRSSSSIRGEYDRRETGARSGNRPRSGRPGQRPSRDEQRAAYERRREAYNRSGGRPRPDAARPTTRQPAPRRAPLRPTQPIPDDDLD